MSEVVLSLSGWERAMMAAWCNIDRTHLRDLLDVGLIYATWPTRYRAPLDARLQQLHDDPLG